ncbi:MAG: hypothetical protein ACRD44_01920, partial [Bryobacteraceae bacterium]
MPTRLALAVFLAAGSLAQEPARNFELLLPDFFDTPFADGVVVDVADRPIQRMSVQVLHAAERNIGYGAVQIKVNGKGVGNAVNRLGNEKGILLVMNPSTIGLRPDQLFDPRENVIEVTAQDRRGRRYYGNWIVRVNESQQNRLFAWVSRISPD